MAGIKSLRVLTEALTASFRYPHVQIGKLPSFDMPPPATIYGHLAGVLGEWFEPAGLEFSYVFEHQGRAIDLETGQPIERGSGKNKYKKNGWDYPVNVECSPNPQRREFLFRPRMTLYLRGPQGLLERLAEKFMAPEFAYVLGRSQDLATCRGVEWIDLQEADAVYFSHTLLPFEWRPWISSGTTVLLPYRIRYYKHRDAAFERYIQIISPPLHIFGSSSDIIAREKLPPLFFVDIADIRVRWDRVLPRAIWFWPVKGPGLASEPA